MVRTLPALALVVVCGPSHGGPVINEFLPDPEGSDGGREFVELMNPGPETVDLSGVRLQFANGAEGAVWTTRWTGPTGSFLAPGALFLIVDRNWQGSAQGQAEVYLGLQNGPDALRLVRDEAVLDLVGYGPLTDAEMMEVAPAAVAVGRAVARRPDGNDTDHNGLDFVNADPTPGLRNFQPYDLVVTDWSLDPPSTDRAGTEIRFGVTVFNKGTETIPVREVSLLVGGRPYRALLDLTPPDAARLLTWRFTPELAGLLPLEIVVPLPVAGDTLVLRPASLQVGPGPLVLNEVMPAPSAGQGEWIEVAAAGPASVELGAFRIRDQDGGWLPLPDMRIGAGEFAVLAQDSLALADWQMANLEHGAHVACDPVVVFGNLRQLRGWPSLNNSPPDGREYADRIYLAGPGGAVVDHLTLADGLTAGRSLERLALKPRNPGANNWAPATAGQGSTPGCANSVSLAGMIPGPLAVEPGILEPGRGATTLHFIFTLDPDHQGWRLRVFDLWGQQVRDLGGEELGPGTRDLPWDGTDESGRALPGGGYVAVLTLAGPRGETRAVRKALLAIR